MSFWKVSGKMDCAIEFSAFLYTKIDVRSTAADPFKENMDYFVVYTLLSSILGHGSKLMAINLLRFDLCLGRSPLPGRPRPTGFPHAHPRISNILDHGSKLMAISHGH